MQKFTILIKKALELFNKLAKENSKPFLFVICLVLLPVILANILYHEKNVEKRGFKIEISENGERVIREEKIIDLATAMQTADASRGAKIFKKCSSCHTIKKGDSARVGPNLWGIVNRKKASSLGFSYSKAMSQKGGNWDIESINQFITKPKEYVEGTKMAFGGLKKPQDRADIILFLQQQK